MFKYLKRKLGIVDDSEWGFEKHDKNKSETSLPETQSTDEFMVFENRDENGKLTLDNAPNNNFMAMRQAQFDEMDKSSLPHGTVIYIVDTNKFCIT